MLIKENKLKQIIKSVLINNFILKEGVISDNVKENWINLINMNKDITFEENNGHKYQSIYGIYELMNQPDHGEEFFNSVFNDDRLSFKINDKLKKNINALYNYVLRNYVSKNKADIKPYNELFENIKSHINKNFDNLLFKNIIKILEKCSQTGIWNKDIINNEINIISTLTENDIIENYLEEIRNDLKNKFKLNYPAEIIFNNLFSRKKYLYNILSETIDNNIIDGVVKRLKSTLEYRKNKNKNNFNSKQKNFEEESGVLQRAGKETGDIIVPKKLKNY